MVGTVLGLMRSPGILYVSASPPSPGHRDNDPVAQMRGARTEGEAAPEGYGPGCEPEPLPSTPSSSLAGLGLRERAGPVLWPGECGRVC